MVQHAIIFMMCCFRMWFPFSVIVCIHIAVHNAMDLSLRVGPSLLNKTMEIYVFKKGHAFCQECPKPAFQQCPTPEIPQTVDRMGVSNHGPSRKSRWIGFVFKSISCIELCINCNMFPVVGHIFPWFEVVFRPDQWFAILDSHSRRHAHTPSCIIGEWFALIFTGW